MRIINIISVLTLCSLSLLSNAQARHCDKAVRFHYPQDGDTVYALTTIEYSFWLINNGPDSLYATDSIAYEVVTAFPAEKEKIRRELGQSIKSGDSLLISDKLWLHKDIEQDKVAMFFSGHLAAGSVYDSHRPLRLEVYPGTLDNNDQVDVAYLKKTTDFKPIEELGYNIYPNPIASGSVLTIEATNINGAVVELVDIYGRRFSINEFKEKLDSIVTFVIPPDLKGMYYLVIVDGEYSYNYKILIE